MARYIEKIHVPVRIARSGQEPMDGFLSLAPYSPAHEGPETLLDLLNAAHRVVPFTRVDKTALLLGRLNLDWVLAGPDVDPVLVHPANWMVTREERVKVRFLDSKAIEGLIQMELPENLNRASDFLNSPEDYFALVTRLGTLLVNKSRVSDVLAYETSPLPLPLIPREH